MLKFSKQADYGLLLMLSLAEGYVVDKAAWLSLKDISDQRKVSYRFMTQIVRPLRKAKLVESREGVSGGYRLTRAPKKITTGDVLRAILGEVEPSTCTSKKGCSKEDCCPAKPIWFKIQETVNTVLDTTPLTALLS